MRLVRRHAGTSLRTKWQTISQCRQYLFSGRLSLKIEVATRFSPAAHEAIWVDPCEFRSLDAGSKSDLPIVAIVKHLQAA